MKKIWVHKARSFKEAAEFEDAYYAKMSKTERIGTMQFLREIYYNIRAPKNAHGKRLRRVVKII